MAFPFKTVSPPTKMMLLQDVMLSEPVSIPASTTTRRLAVKTFASLDWFVPKLFAPEITLKTARSISVAVLLYNLGLFCGTRGGLSEWCVNCNFVYFCDNKWLKIERTKAAPRCPRGPPLMIFIFGNRSHFTLESETKCSCSSRARRAADFKKKIWLYCWN